MRHRGNGKVGDVWAALQHLRLARARLLRAGAKKSAERVRLAITSTGGALRHARLAPYRERRQGGAS